MCVKVRSLQWNKKSEKFWPLNSFSTPKKVWNFPLGDPLADVLWSLLCDSKLSPFKSYQLLLRLNPTAEMVEQTTKPNHGKTGSENVRPLILRSRENLYLIAETRTFITGFRDAVTLCSKMVDHVFQIMDDCLLTCMVPYYTNLLEEQINTVEAYLGKSQRNLDKLITIHPGYCADIHQLATSFSSCKERLQGVKERGKHFTLANWYLKVPWNQNWRVAKQG